MPGDLTETPHMWVPWCPSNVSEGCRYHALLMRTWTMQTTRTHLEDMMLSEMRQSEKNEYCVIPFTGGPQRSEIPKDRRQNARWRPGARGGGERDVGFHGDRVSVLQDEKSSAEGGGDGCTTMCMCLTPLNCAPENGQDGIFHVPRALPQFARMVRVRRR